MADTSSQQKTRQCARVPAPFFEISEPRCTTAARRRILWDDDPRYVWVRGGTHRGRCLTAVMYRRPQQG